MPPRKRKLAISPAIQKSCAEYKKKLRSHLRRPPPPPKLSEKERQKYTIESPYPQRFSLPQSIMYYIARHPTNVQCHQNLMKSCKSLFRMSRIIPIKKFKAGYSDHKNTSMIIDNIDEKMSCKFWFYDKFYLVEYSDKLLASKLIQLAYTCSLKDLTMYSQILTFRELDILVSGRRLEKIDFVGNTIKEDDGSITEFGKIFEAIVCVNTHISLWSRVGFSEDSIKRMGEILATKDKRHCVRVRNIPEEISLETLTALLQAPKKRRFHLVKVLFSSSFRAMRVYSEVKC